MAVRIRIIGVPHRHCDHAHRIFELLEVPRTTHAEPLFEHFGAINPGHTHRHRDTLFIEHHRTMHALADLDLFIAHASIGLLHFQSPGLTDELFEFAIELVFAVAHFEAIEVDGVDGVDGASPAAGAIESDHRHRKSDLWCAVKVVAGRGEMHFHIRIEVFPDEMGIDDQHRFTAC